MDILYQDNRIVVAIKPPGVLSTDEPGGMPDLLRAALCAACIRTVHRLDRKVGGVMVCARSRKAAAILAAQIQRHAFQKDYLAVVRGFAPAQGTLRDWLLRDTYAGITSVVPEGTAGAKEAILTYTRLASKNDTSLLQIHLLTGRTHQIRVQFSAHGHPLIGDCKYGRAEDGGIALWSYRVGFYHPERGDFMSFSCPPDGIAPFSAYSACFSSNSAV